jgi:hypothetical protein
VKLTVCISYLDFSSIHELQQYKESPLDVKDLNLPKDFSGCTSYRKAQMYFTSASKYKEA